RVLAFDGEDRRAPRGFPAAVDEADFVGCEGEQPIDRLDQIVRGEVRFDGHGVGGKPKLVQLGRPRKRWAGPGLSARGPLRIIPAAAGLRRGDMTQATGSEPTVREKVQGVLNLIRPAV